MIDLKISFQVSSDGKDLTVADTTVWPSDGVNRNAVNLHLFALNTLGETVATPVFEGDDITPSVQSWLLSNASDGCYKVILVTAPTFNPANTYLKNELVSFEGTLYRATKNLTVGTALTAENCWYKVLTAHDVLAITSFPNASYLIGHFLKDDHTRSCIAEKALAYGRKSCGCSDLCSQIEDYHWTTLYYDAAVYSFGFGDYTDAGKFLGSAFLRCGGAEDSPCNCH